MFRGELKEVYLGMFIVLGEVLDTVQTTDVSRLAVLVLPQGGEQRPRLSGCQGNSI
jgi:hypothetical protein